MSNQKSLSDLLKEVDVYEAVKKRAEPSMDILSSLRSHERSAYNTLLDHARYFAENLQYIIHNGLHEIDDENRCDSTIKNDFYKLCSDLPNGIHVNKSAVIYYWSLYIENQINDSDLDSIILNIPNKEIPIYVPNN